MSVLFIPEETMGLDIITRSGRPCISKTNNLFEEKYSFAAKSHFIRDTFY